MNSDKAAKIYNYICNNFYGGKFPDLELEKEHPDLHTMFMEELLKPWQDKPIEYTISDKIAGVKLLLECLAEMPYEDIEAGVVEIDHDLGYSSFSFQDIARMALECIVEKDKTGE